MTKRFLAYFMDGGIFTYNKISQNLRHQIIYTTKFNYFIGDNITWNKDELITYYRRTLWIILNIPISFNNIQDKLNKKIYI